MSIDAKDIFTAQEKFGKLIENESARIERMKQAEKPTDFSTKDKIVVGILPGDGIGPIIMKQALRVLRVLAAPEIESGKVEIREIEGMTIENRVAKLQSLPPEVLAEVKQCDVLLKGPMVTPRAGDGLPNLISANSLLRRELELFAAVRPIRIPDKNIDWTFFRENIEGEYIWGDKGMQHIEEAHPLGRLFDIDVLDSEGHKLSRPQYRPCLICGNQAQLCARTRRHTVAEMQAKIEEMLSTWKNSNV